MLVLAWLLILMMMKMKSDAASAEIITAHSGETVLLDSNLTGPVLDRRQDVRWTHPRLLLRNNKTRCEHGRCELLRNGSLRFSRVQTADAGNYSLTVFDEGGKLMMTKVVLLRVEFRDTTADDGSSSSSVVVSVLTCCFLLMLLFIIIFILRRRKRRMTIAAPLQENVYVVMHSSHSNEGKDEEEPQSSHDPLEKNVYEMMHTTNKAKDEEEGKHQREQDSSYDPLEKNVYEMMHTTNKGKDEEEGKHQRMQGSSYETPITKNMSVDVEEIYV